MIAPTPEQIFESLVTLVQYKLSEKTREDLIDFSLIQFGIFSRDVRKKVMAEAHNRLNHDSE